MPVATLECWLKAAQIGKLGDVSKTSRPLTEIELELAKTKRELAEVKMERDLLKKRQRTLPGKYSEVRDNKGIYRRIIRCRLYAVSTMFRRAGITLGLGVHHRNGHKMTERLEVEIRAAHQRTRETYDPERLQGDLAKNGINTSVHSIKRIRRKLGMRYKQKRKLKVIVPN